MWKKSEPEWWVREANESGSFSPSLSLLSLSLLSNLLDLVARNKLPNCRLLLSAVVGG